MKNLGKIILLLVAVFIVSSCATAEVRAVRQGDLQQLEKFLSSGGDPNTFYAEGNALIHIAVQYGQAGSLEKLLLAGANPNLLNSTGNTAAFLAAGKNRHDMINILINYNGDMRIPGNGGKTTLMLAAANGNIQMMEKLLSAGVSLEAIDSSGLSALFYSVSSKNSDGMSFLLKSGSNAGLLDKKGRTPLHLLTQNRHRSYARLLIQAGTDPYRQQNSTGETPLHIASGTGAWELVEEYLANGVQPQINLLSTRWGAPLFYALKPEIPTPAATRTINLLLNAGADPNLANVQNILPIVFAVEKLDVPLVEILIQAGAEINMRLPERRTLLHIAASRDMPELASVLISSGLNANLKDLQGNTALYISVVKPARNTAEVLLALGADPNIINNAGQTVLLITLKKDAALQQGLSFETSLLLRYKAALPPGKNILPELLLRTAESGNAEVAGILLESGANPDEMTREGKTILMQSSARGFIELSEILLIKGARVNMRDEKGNTAMHLSSAAGSVKGVELLLHYGENPDPINYEKIRPIQLAPENGQGLRITEILLNAGANPIPQEEKPVIEVIVEDHPVVEENNNKEIIIEIDSETTAEEYTNDEEWDKARVLFIEEKEPRGISERRTTFTGYSALVPESYPKNLSSRSNPREVVIYIRNEVPGSVEIYLVNSGGEIEAISIISSGEFFEVKTQQGNVYPVYSQDNRYFGEIQVTGQVEQYYRLVEEE